jgi:hypothetical protein
VLAKITYAGVMAGTSFRQGSQSLTHLAGRAVSAKQVERVVRRIGRERTDQRDAQVEAFLRLPLAEKSRPPQGVSPPELAVVMADGGRLQILDRAPPPADATAAADALAPPEPDQTPSEPGGVAGDGPPLAADADAAEPGPVKEPGSKGKHWREDKVGLLLQMASVAGPHDPCPAPPPAFLNPVWVANLVRELKAKARAAEPPAEDPTQAAEGPTQPPPKAAADGSSWDPPEVKHRKVVASRQSWKAFAPILAAAAWSLGFFASGRRAFVGDGSSHVWGLWRRHFGTFVPILDIIHALAYVSAAALAGRTRAEGWPVYRRWIDWVWRGEVSRVIGELAQRQREVGVATKEDKEGSPPQVVNEALTYLSNHQGQMKYHEYRRQGLPITSSHVESEVKRINYRVKGTEKFWSEQGAEWVLQLRADYLSDDQPMDAFWQQRQAEESGQRCYRQRH